MLAIALGPINGSVFIGVGAHADFQAATGKPLSLGIGADLLITGNVDICGIISASIVFKMSVSYQVANGTNRLVGTGEFSITIKICWCFTLSVHCTLTMGFNTSGNANNPGTAMGKREPILLAMASNSLKDLDIMDSLSDSFYRDAAKRYLSMFDDAPLAAGAAGGRN
jgi:hypothetical protein